MAVAGAKQLWFFQHQEWLLFKIRQASNLSSCEFIQVATYAVGTGALCLVVFRALSGIPFGAIWHFSDAAPHFHVNFQHVLLGEFQSFQDV